MKRTNSTKRLQRLCSAIADIENPSTINPHKAAVRKQRLVAKIRTLCAEANKIGSV